MKKIVPQNTSIVPVNYGNTIIDTIEKSSIVKTKKSKNIVLDSQTPIKSKESKQPKKRKSWFFTFNNYTIDDINTLKEKFNSVCEKYIFQEEKGKGTFNASWNEDGNCIKTDEKEGTTHLQGVIFLHDDMRPTELNLSDRIHWEGTRNKKASINYCSKLESSNGKTYSKNIMVNKLSYIKPTDFYDWQKEIYNIILDKPNDRTVHYIYGNGNDGKSLGLCRTLGILHSNECIQIDDGDDSDVKYLISNFICDEDGNQREDKNLKCVILDLPREFNIEKLNSKTIEKIKNGCCVNLKYKGKTNYFNPPHLIIFTNTEPSSSVLKKLTLDRWKIGEIKEKKIDWKNTNDFLI
ncbi:replication-associated protein [Crucivirus-212]|nr:replication-associated protein [Crucivirus-212]